MTSQCSPPCTLKTIRGPARRSNSQRKDSSSSDDEEAILLSSLVSPVFRLTCTSHSDITVQFTVYPLRFSVHNECIRCYNCSLSEHSELLDLIGLGLDETSKYTSTRYKSSLSAQRAVVVLDSFNYVYSLWFFLPKYVYFGKVMIPSI